MQFKCLYYQLAMDEENRIAATGKERISVHGRKANERIIILLHAQQNQLSHSQAHW